MLSRPSRILPLTCSIVALCAICTETSAAILTWQTAGTTNNWSTSATDTNWYIDSAATLAPWTDGNAAVFDANPGETVTLVGTVAPTATTIGTSDGTWTLNGSGALGGAGPLTKNGTGLLTFANTTANTFSGGTTINGGILSLGTGAANSTTVNALGTGAVAINAGGTLRLWLNTSTATTYTIPNALTINGGTLLGEDGVHVAGGAIAVGTSGATFSARYNGKTLTASGVISGSGPVVVQRTALNTSEANATVIFLGANTYSGGTTVNSGIFQLGNALATDYGGTGRIRGTLTLNAGATLLSQGSNTLGYTSGAKIDTFNLVGGTFSHAGSADNGWGVTYNLTAGLMQTTGSGRFSFGFNTLVNTLAAATTSTIAGSVNLRENNTNNVVPFTVADGAAATDLLVTANITQNAVGYGITKNGPGLMALAGTNTFSGATTINSGTLQVTNSGSLAASTVIVNDTGTLLIDTVGKTIGGLALSNGASLALAASPASTLTATGAITANGTITVTPIVAAPIFTGNVVNLVTGGSATGAPTFNTVLPAGSRLTGSTVLSGNSIQFTATTGVANLIYTNASGTGIWNTTDANFLNGSSSDVFLPYDAVTFDNTAATKTVSTTGTLTPSLVTVNNSTGNDYTLAGTGTLSGSGSLVKSGTGTATLGGTLTYALGGRTTVSGGTLDLGGKNITGSSFLTLNGGTLNNGTFAAANVDLQSGTVGAVLAGTGPVSKTTAGILILTGANTYTSATTVAAGTLQVGNAGATGSFGATAVSVATDAVVAYNRSNAVTVSNAFSGAGTLRQDGAGTMTLGTGATTLPTNLVVSAGTSLVAQGGGFGADRMTGAGKVTVNAGATLTIPTGSAHAFGGSNSTMTESFVINGGTLTLNQEQYFNKLSLSGATVSGAAEVRASAATIWEVIGTAPSTISAAVSNVNAVNWAIGDVTSSVAADLTVSGGIIGTGALNKAGSGTMLITSSAAYSGPTNISDGSLLVSGSLTGSSAINVTGGSFGGTGSVASPVTVGSGAGIVGGNDQAATGGLTITNGLTLGDSSYIRLTLDAGGLHSSLIRSSSSAWTFDSDQAFTFLNVTPGSYDNIISGLSTNPGVALWTVTNAGYTGTFTYDGTGGVDLTLAAVPEPGSAMIVSSSAGLLLGWSRRRRRAAL